MISKHNYVWGGKWEAEEEIAEFLVSVNEEKFHFWNIYYGIKSTQDYTSWPIL